LLLVGRVFAAAVGFVTQVLIVRALSKADYGVFAYGLSVVTLAETAMTLGMDRAVSRFVPIYEERGEHEKALGTIVAVVALVTGLGVLLVTVASMFPSLVSGSFSSDDAAVKVIVVLVLLAPVQALDNLLVGLFAVFDRPRAIFVRRFVLGPLLRLLVVVLLLVSGQGGEFLAAGYVAAGAVGVALYAGVLVGVLRSRAILVPGAVRRIRVPFRELVFFALPLFSTDLVFVMLEAMDAILVGYFGTAADVAELRAVQPVARLNQLVLASFGLLFTPVAARLFARRRNDEIRRLYWSSAIWIAALSYPAFLVSFALAEPLTVALFGARYEQSAGILAILALGYFFNASLGFNGLTLNVFGLVRPVVMINLLSLVVNLVLNLALIPVLGPVGAAIGTTTTLVTQNLARQLFLARRTGVPFMDRGAAAIYLRMALGVVALLTLQLLIDPPLALGLLAAGAISIATLTHASGSMQLAETFPEIARLPLVRRLVRPRS